MRRMIIASLLSLTVVQTPFAKTISVVLPGLEAILRDKSVKVVSVKPAVVVKKPKHPVTYVDFSGNWTGQCENDEGDVFASSANIVSNVDSIVMNGFMFQFENVTEFSANNPQLTWVMRMTVEWADGNQALLFKFLNHSITHSVVTYAHVATYGSQKMSLENGELKLSLIETMLSEEEVSKVSQTCYLTKQ